MQGDRASALAEYVKLKQADARLAEQLYAVYREGRSVLPNQGLQGGGPPQPRMLDAPPGRP